jgi:hypothetical protein
MKLFWTLWILDAIAALSVLYFFFIGLADGTVSSGNAGLWLIILLILAGILAGGYYFFNHGQLRIAYTLLSVLAIPALLMFLFAVFMIFGDIRWN